ncbi:MAG: hypothetical protein HY909_31890 [Deltaproteobacteria bacterium]|nr:hypothetical protein [Deltaproteobacteria bacterium]
MGKPKTTRPRRASAAARKAPRAPAKRALAPALKKRADALRAAAQARARKRGRAAVAHIRELREHIADDYFDIGQALVTLGDEDVVRALGYDDRATMLRAELDLSVTTADKLVELATRVDRSVLRTLDQERAAAVLALVDATPEPDTFEGLLTKPFALPGGEEPMDLRAAPVEAIKGAARTLRQGRVPPGKRGKGFTTTPEERAAFAEAIAPVERDRGLRAATTFRLVASRKGHGPVVEVRIPLRMFDAAVRLLAKGK